MESKIMSCSIRVALANINSSHISLEENYNRLKKAIIKVKNKDVDIIVFCENFLNTGEECELKENYIERISLIKQKIISLSINYNIAIGVGLVDFHSNNFYITYKLFLPSGKVFTYKKIHLGLKEKQLYESGDDIEVLNYKGFVIGIQICLDTHIPDFTTICALKGADLIIAPFKTPHNSKKRISYWKKYIPTRSYDGFVYFACINRMEEDSSRYGGGVFVTDPFGNVIIEYDKKEEGIITFDIDKEHLKNIKSRRNAMASLNFLDKRRQEVYNKYY